MKPLRILLASALIAAAPAAAFAADDAAVVAGLKAMAADWRAPPPAGLDDYGFTEATYLVDKLSQNDLRKLRRHINNRFVDLPANIESAIVAKTPQPRGSNR